MCCPPNRQLDTDRSIGPQLEHTSHPHATSCSGISALAGCAGSVPGRSGEPSELSSNGPRRVPLDHHLFHIAIAERIPQIPAHTEQNDLVLEVSSMEQNWPLLPLRSYPNKPLFVFATEPLQLFSDSERDCLPALHSREQKDSDARRPPPALVPGPSCCCRCVSWKTCG